MQRFGQNLQLIIDVVINSYWRFFFLFFRKGGGGDRVKTHSFVAQIAAQHNSITI